MPVILRPWLESTRQTERWWMDRLGVWDGDVLSLRGHCLASSLLKALGPLFLF